jgi:hypothetical protein
MEIIKLSSKVSISTEGFFCNTIYMVKPGRQLQESGMYLYVEASVGSVKLVQKLSRCSLW